MLDADGYSRQQDVMDTQAESESVSAAQQHSPVCRRMEPSELSTQISAQYCTAYTQTVSRYYRVPHYSADSPPLQLTILTSHQLIT